jgi:uncharacterized protein (TIGR03083 family)
MTTQPPVPSSVPAGLRDRVLTAATHARAAGIAVPEVRPAAPAEAFSGAVSALYQLLRSLSEADWQVPVIRGLDAQGLIGHLIGVEKDVHRCLVGDAAVARADHVGSTQAEALGQRGRPAEETREEWYQAACRTIAILTNLGGLDAGVVLHGVPLPVRDLLVARVFELWTHENDIRAAAGRPASVPDPPSLRSMAALATAYLPFGAARSGLRDPVRARLVLTGPGGGTWDVLLGPPRASGQASLRIVADVAGFCRLVGNRVAPADLDAQVSGDHKLAESVLAAAAALALD